MPQQIPEGVPQPSQWVQAGESLSRAKRVDDFQPVNLVVTGEVLGIERFDSRFEACGDQLGVPIRQAIPLQRETARSRTCQEGRAVAYCDISLRISRKA